jgi:hypothetical protein
MPKTVYTESLIYVIIINKDNHINLATTGFGLLRSQSKILCINDEDPKRGLAIVRKWHFTGESVAEFKYLLFQESWQKVFVYSELNTKFYNFKFVHPRCVVDIF